MWNRSIDEFHFFCDHKFRWPLGIYHFLGYLYILILRLSFLSIMLLLLDLEFSLAPCFLLETLSFLLCEPVFLRSLVWLLWGICSLATYYQMGFEQTSPFARNCRTTFNLWLVRLLQNLFGIRRHIERYRDPLYFLLAWVRGLRLEFSRPCADQAEDSAWKGAGIDGLRYLNPF